MQSQVPELPVVCSDGKKRTARDTEEKDDSSSVKVKNHNTCKFSSDLVSNRKQLRPLVGGPYRNSMRLYAMSESIRSTNKTSVGQRVMSAKMLRVKQLQNQLADAHYHLNDLANENRLLKALQKRQDSALRKYEGTNAELPRIINSHHEELKVLQTRYKKLRIQHKQTCDLLKEKENEIHTLQTQNKHLMQLSKDRHLEEREKLQMRVSDLNFRIEQQQETIQTLNRKLALESKSLKHQLNSEVAKHKETQKHLHETLGKLKTLEDLLDNREKRLYYSGRLPICNKGNTMGSQSLMNLGQNGVSLNPLKSGSKHGGGQNEPENGNLPKLTRTESSDDKAIFCAKEDRMDEKPITETMSSLQQVRKFRLQKSYSRGGSASLLSTMEKSDDEETSREATDGTAKYSSMEKLRAKRATINGPESDDDDEIKRFVDNLEMTSGKEIYKLPRELMKEFGYSSSDSESDTADNRDKEKLETNLLANKSRDLHTRLIAEQATVTRRSISSTKVKKKISSSRSESESESENEGKNLPTSLDDYSHALQGKSRNGKDSVELSVDDFLKLDINTSEPDVKSSGLRIDNETLEKSSPSNDLSSEGYENTQQQLLSVTKSWTEVQARIKREREISERQLKALEEETPGDYSLEKTLNSVRADENLQRSNELTHDESFKFQTKINDRESLEKNIEIAPKNGVIQESQMEEKVSLNKTELADDRRKSIEGKESNAMTKNPRDLTDSSRTSDEISKKATGIEKISPPDIKLINFNKQKLLAAMKAIDDNENIDFSSNQKSNRAPNSTLRTQIAVTENLYRGLPTHARKKDDLLKEIFGDGKIETKVRGGCSKLH